MLTNIRKLEDGTYSLQAKDVGAVGGDDSDVEAEA